MKKVLGRFHRSRSWHSQGKHVRADKDGTFVTEELSPSPQTIPSDDSASDGSMPHDDNQLDFACQNDSPIAKKISKGSALVGVDDDVLMYLDLQHQSKSIYKPKAEEHAWTHVETSRVMPPQSTNALTKVISFGRVRSSFWRQTLLPPPTSTTLEVDWQSLNQIENVFASKKVKFAADEEDDLFSVATPVFVNSDETDDDVVVGDTTAATSPTLLNGPSAVEEEAILGCLTKEQLIICARLFVSDATACCNG